MTHNEITTTGKYPCPSQLTVDGRVKTNYDSEGYSYPLTLKQALDVSCDTFFYAPAVNEYYADQTLVDAARSRTSTCRRWRPRSASAPVRASTCRPTSRPPAATPTARRARPTGTRTRPQYCAEAAAGYPDETDPTQRAYLTELARENCTDGWRYRAGDNADMAIGQGETTVSPLQLAVAYSAMLNGGTVWNPTIGWAEVDANGKVVKTINPTVKSKVPVAQSTLSTIANDLQFTPDHSVSGALAFDGAPVQDAARRQDRNGRGLRQAGHLLARVVGAGDEERGGQPDGEVRRRRHGRAGRDGRERGGADGARGLQRPARSRPAGRAAVVDAGEPAAEDRPDARLDAHRWRRRPRAPAVALPAAVATPAARTGAQR